MKSAPVILYSTSLRRWEVWQGGRPVAHGSVEACMHAYPTAPEPSQHQRDLAAADVS